MKNPVISGPALHEEQRYSSFLSEPSVSGADSVRVDELCRRSYVRARHVPGFASANDFLSSR